MKKTTLRVLAAWAMIAFFVIGCDGGGGCGEVIAPDVKGIRPIVFVHGMAGSGDQFETQALRFASNAYPEDFFVGFDYNTIRDRTLREDGLDAAIDAVLRRTGADKIDLVAHSMGTVISQKYLSNRARAAKVAHYVNVDGQAANALPGGVPSLSILATDLGGEIAGGENVRLMNHTHVQAISSPETFEHMYTFLTGQIPATTDVLPAPTETIALKGRLLGLISNNVPTDTHLSIYEVHADTGQRVSDTPAYAGMIDADGHFDFANARRGASYEFNATRDGQVEQMHWYYLPFARTDTLIRLKFSQPGTALYDLIDRSEEASSVIVVRNREIQGVEIGGMGLDSVQINGIEICAGLLPGGTGVNKSGPIGIAVFDKAVDGISDLSSPLDAFNRVAFILGVDLAIPAAIPASGVVSVVLKDRYTQKTQTINVPNWDSATHTTFTQFEPL